MNIAVAPWALCRCWTEEYSVTHCCCWFRFWGFRPHDHPQPIAMEQVLTSLIMLDICRQIQLCGLTAWAITRGHAIRRTLWCSMWPSWDSSQFFNIRLCIIFSHWPPPLCYQHSGHSLWPKADSRTWWETVCSVGGVHHLEASCTLARRLGSLLVSHWILLAILLVSPF